MSKTKQPKRIKAWVNEYDWGLGVARESAREAKEHVFSRHGGALRVAVPLIELRRGEVVVDVEALVAAFLKAWAEEPFFSLRERGDGALRAALKKVGVR